VSRCELGVMNDGKIVCRGYQKHLIIWAAVPLMDSTAEMNHQVSQSGVIHKKNVSKNTVKSTPPPCPLLSALGHTLSRTLLRTSLNTQWTDSWTSSN